MVSEIQLFARYAQGATLRVLLSAFDVPKPPPVSPRTRIDRLRWTMEGRTLWEVHTCVEKYAPSLNDIAGSSPQSRGSCETCHAGAAPRPLGPGGRARAKRRDAARRL